MLKKLEEFETYIKNNAGLIPDYGERWRYGETITTAFVESTINQVVSKGGRPYENIAAFLSC